MKILAALFCVFAISSAEASDIRIMTIGKDTFAFDYTFVGRPIVVDLDMEGAEHDWFMIEDYFDSNDLKGIPFYIGRSLGINNAFATIHKGERYIVHDPAYTGQGDYYSTRTFILAHEISHHLCGHVENTMNIEPWAKELEADQNAGVLLRKRANSIIDLNTILENTKYTLSEEPSPTHPPRAMRLAAIYQGYQTGTSPCVGRVVSKNVESASLNPGAPASALSKLWNHNGSIMQLAADGASRKFYYVKPRDGLESVGISSGTLLFSGTKSDNFYSGTAYVFSPRCGARPYAVSGPVSDDQRQVTMYGKAPIPNSNCRIGSYRDDTLVFTFVGD